jgi:hypothetical protein
MPFVPDQPRKSRFVPDAQPAAPDEFAGDDLLSNESMANLSAGVHPTPTAEPSALKGVNAYGSGINDAAGEFNRAKPAGLAGQLDALTTMATGGIAAPVLGTIESAVVGTDPAKAHERYTWQPRTESGKALLKLLGAGMAPITESGADIALGPIAAADSQVMRAAGRTAPKEVPLIPSTRELTAAAKTAYATGKESGVFVSPESYSQALGNVRKMVTEEGIDPTLHAKSSAVMKRLEGADGKPLSLQEAETLRKVAMDAEDDLNPVTREPTPDARIAGKIVDELDESIDALTVNSPARELYRRSRLSQMLDKMERNAEINAGAHYTQAGMEHALRQEFKKLAKNDRRMRGLNQAQRQSIEKVAKGGPVENSLRVLGKFDPTTGGVAAAASIGTSGMLSAATGNPLGMLLPPAGFIGKRMATRMTQNNVSAAREALVGRTDVNEALARAVQEAAARRSAAPAAAQPGLFETATPTQEQMLAEALWQARIKSQKGGSK